MKMINLRANEPVMKIKLEDGVEGKSLNALLTSVVDRVVATFPGATEFSFRIRSVSVLATNTSGMGIQGAWSILGRTVFPVLRSNVLSASMNSEGHILSLWNKATISGTAPDLTVSTTVDQLIVDQVGEATGVYCVVYLEIIA